MQDQVDRIVAEWGRVRPDLDVSASHVLLRIVRGDLLVTVSFAELFARYGLSYGEWTVLAALRRSGPPYRMNPTTLFNSVILSSGAMTNRLDRLEDLGHVRRLPDPNDRRGRLVALTTKGRELVDKAVVDQIASGERLLSGLSAADRTKLADLLRKLLLSEPFRTLDPESKAQARATTKRSGPRRAARRSRRASGAATNRETVVAHP